MQGFHGRVRSGTDLGRIVTRLRKDAGLTQRQLAELLGVSTRYLNELETGKPKRADEHFFAVLDRLGVSLSAEVK